MTLQKGTTRKSVATYSDLPLTENVKGDLRTVADINCLYSWTSDSPNGTLQDWRKLTVSKSSDMSNGPTLSSLAIDNAILAFRNIFMNYLVLFFKQAIFSYSPFVKMVDGYLDTFELPNTVDVTKSSMFKYIKSYFLSSNGFDAFYETKFNVDFDDYTKVLIHGGNQSYDSLKNPLEGVISDANPHWYYTYLDSNPNSGFLAMNGWGPRIPENPLTKITFINDCDIYNVNGIDFTWDLWIMRFAESPDAPETILSYGDGDNFSFNIINGILNAKLTTVSNLLLEVNGTSHIALDTWVHVAVERKSGYLKVYVNGVLEGTSATSSTESILPNLVDAKVYLANVVGDLDEIRYSHGIARYDANFTPMAYPYNFNLNTLPCDNMVLQSSSFEAEELPTSARITIFQAYTQDNMWPIDNNVDIKAYISRDGGVTFTQATLAVESNLFNEAFYNDILKTNVNFYVGTVDLSSQPEGTSMVWKITSHNNKDLLIRAVGFNWA